MRPACVTKAEYGKKSARVYFYEKAREIDSNEYEVLLFTAPHSLSPIGSIPVSLVEHVPDDMVVRDERGDRFWLGDCG